MNIRELKEEELEKLSNTELAYYLLKEGKKQLSTLELFNEVCSLNKSLCNNDLNLIGEFYTALTIDKRFLLLSDTKWDLKENHSIKTVVEDELDELDGIDISDELIEELENEEEILSEEEEESLDDTDSLEDTDDLDELDDLTVIDEEEIDSDDII